MHFGQRLSVRSIGPYLLSLTRYERDAHLPLHAHERPFATVVVGGRYRETVRGATRICAADAIVVHEPQESHADTFAATTTCLDVHGPSFERSAVLSTPAATAMAMKLRREFRHPDAFSSMVIESVMLELAAESGRGVRDEHRAPAWLRQLRETIEERFCEPLTIAELAASAGVHPTHAARAFRHCYGTTAGELLRELRVGYAKQRLASNDSLFDIAADCGFADQSHFTRTFRRATGTTPAAFRRGLR